MSFGTGRLIGYRTAHQAMSAGAEAVRMDKICQARLLDLGHAWGQTGQGPLGELPALLILSSHPLLVCLFMARRLPTP